MDAFVLARPFAQVLALMGLIMILIAPIPYVIGKGEPI